MRPDVRGSAGDRVAVLHVRNRLTQAAHTSAPLSLRDTKHARGIAIGRDTCHADALVSAEHGTLECTPQHGIWVYVDHSENGTTLNDKQMIHRDAAIVRDGDKLLVGNTEITLALQIQRRRGSDDNNQTVTSPASTASSPSTVHSPSPPSTPMPPSLLARQLLPNIQTATSRLQQPSPEYINSPIPGSNWRKKRHSISHVSRVPMTLGLANNNASISSSQTFARSKPLVPSAPSTPPQKDAPAARHVAHLVTSQSPQSAFNHVKFKEEPETISIPDKIPEDVALNQPHDSNQTDVTPAPSPPLEYSSSPMTAGSGMSFLNRLQHSPSSAPVVSKPSPPSAPSPAVPFAHTHHYEPPARTSNRPVDLRIQVAKRNAGLASAAAAARPFSAGATTTPTTSAAASRPVVLTRGITIPPPTVPPSSGNPQSKRPFEVTPPASPVAHQDILRQKQTLLDILKNKYKEEQKLKREQEEWMRSQFPSAIASSPSGSATVPSMSPIRHDKEGGLEDSDDDDSEIVMPAKAPALLRTVSLGQTLPAMAHLYHQPSPRLTQAVLASRARKGGTGATFSPRSGSAVGSSSQHHARVRSSSDGSSVASSVSTEPSNHRRVLCSPSFALSRVSAELSDFMGYDDDDGDDAFVSFTAYYGDSGLDDPLRAQTPGSLGSRTRGGVGRRARAPSLDDEMAGVLNSPSHASSSFSRPKAFESVIPKEPRSVAKPRARSADVRRTEPSRPSRHVHRLGIDLDRSPV